ncbi:hypothetical protein UK23_05935 [Lentzea aerocolonigenes]|uniref:Uncharacterized protein n=1 Tax=Lentzea aerocolonigenes TaxID=68170 RepID=A0A0F0H9X7_LENAE|nr:hypothetical protein [Lentzea aerocolonigenes]KJK51661.1 hypothetical protein UK23_05935 [Lentzea aerocolonigenes]
MRSSRDPAVLLAAIRATGALPMTDITQAELDTMRRRTKSAGRALLRCAPAAGTANLRRSGVVTLGWSPHTTPSPEDSNAYPVRRLAPTTRLTWACCLGLAWPDRTADPFPGEPFTTSLVVDVAAELGLAASWVNSALKHELIPALLVEVSQGTTLRLGPAAAAIPPAFVDSNQAVPPPTSPA